MKEESERHMLNLGSRKRALPMETKSSLAKVVRFQGSSKKMYPVVGRCNRNQEGLHGQCLQGVYCSG